MTTYLRDEPQSPAGDTLREAFTAARALLAQRRSAYWSALPQAAASLMGPNEAQLEYDNATTAALRVWQAAQATS